MSHLRITDHPSVPARILRLDAPQRRNALTASTVEHLEHLLGEDPAEVLVLGSSTADTFCAGADLSADDATRAALSDRLYACYELMVTRPGLVLAVVEGAAVGGGAQLTSAADLRFASPAARWRWVGPGHGLAVGGWILTDLMGRSRALDLTMTGRWLDADEALLAGFATVGEDPWALADATLNHLASADPDALARLKQITGRGPLLDRLSEERTTNAASWTGGAPSPRDAADEGRRQSVDRDTNAGG